MPSREKARFGKVMFSGVKFGAAGDDKLVLFEDGIGDALLATGTAIPADTTDGYAKGCLFIDTNVVTGTSGLYVNVGTKSACVFKLVSNA